MRKGEFLLQSLYSASPTYPWIFSYLSQGILRACVCVHITCTSIFLLFLKPLGIGFIPIYPLQ